MSEGTDAPQGGAEVEAVADTSTQVETNSEATTEQQTGADNPDLADDTGEATKRVPWFQKRIDEVTAKKYEAEREAAYWRGIAEASRGQPAPQQQQVEIPDRYEDPDGYDRWLINQAKEAAKAELLQDNAARTFEERVAATRAAKPDYDTVVMDPLLRITDEMAEVIRESDKGPEVAYYLGTNRAEAARIAQLSPRLQAKELGKIEAALSAPAAPAPSKTIPLAPPQTVGGLSAGLTKPLGEMSMAEYIAARNKGQS